MIQLVYISTSFVTYIKTNNNNGKVFSKLEYKCFPKAFLIGFHLLQIKYFIIGKTHC